MAEIVLGPVLRFVGRTEATVWLNTDQPCEVEILGHRTQTFRVGDHHFALARIGGLEPGTQYHYEVLLDGDRVWPAPALSENLPQPSIRTRTTDATRITFGSCRAAAPSEPPWSKPVDADAQAYGGDALVAYATRMIRQDPADWPDLLLMLGDQVYADDASPKTREFIRSRRDTSKPPGEEVADLTEYHQLYHEAWSQPDLLRWIQSSVPSAMIFDDHDVIDDWNISRSWLEDARATDWWHERIVGGFVSYWLYQHLGNLTPAQLDQDEVWQAVQKADDAEPLLRDFAYNADRDPASYRWSFARTLGATHLVVVDSRAGRTFDGDERDMLDPSEWRWLEDAMAVDCEHLVVASSLPVFLAPFIHYIEQWNVATARDAWTPLFRGPAEGIRRALDLEHWPAFPKSFDRLTGLLRQAASRPGGPKSVTILSGDVHHGFVTRVRWSDPVDAPVWQVVASPMRQSMPRLVRHGFRVSHTRRWTALGRAISALARVPGREPDWKMTDGPIFENHIGTIELRDGRVDATLECVRDADDPSEAPHLEPAIRRALSR